LRPDYSVARYGGPWIALRALRHTVWERLAPELGLLYDRVESRQLRAQLEPAARDGGNSRRHF
jgi:hypothetical protein